MKVTAAALAELKTSIAESKTKFISTNNGAEASSDPEFVYGYDIEATDAALESYEAAIPGEYEAGKHVLTVSQKLLMQSKEITENHEDIEMRDFARAVSAYMIANVPISRRIRPSPFRELEIVHSVMPD